MKTALNKSMLVSIAILGWLGASIYLFYNQPMNPPLLLEVFPAFLRSVFSINYKLPDRFCVDMLFELVSLSLCLVVGILFLRLFIRLPKLIEWIVAAFMGVGLSTFILELWAIPFLLNRWTVLLTFALLIVLLLGLKKYWGWASDDVLIKESVKAATNQNKVHNILFWCVWAILAGLTLLNFYHSLLFPVQYWDSLILYIHYGKMTYQQGGFPILACLQVGLGLGANYPHLYPLHQAVTATIFNHWSDIYGQLIAPLAGLGSILVLYHLSFRLFRNRLIAILSTLVFRSIPFVSTYFVYASDYALVMFYTAVFLLFMEMFLSKPSLRTVMPLMAVSAIFPHINYLGWIVWPPMFLAILWRSRDIVAGSNIKWLQLLGAFLFWFGLGLTWYIRNYLVTGNPVYAFFPEIFGGKNINLEVLASCQKEWTAHGMGAAQYGSSLWARVLNSLVFFQSDWRFSPLLTGIMLPAFLLGWKKKQPIFVFAGILFALYFVYQYIISGLYWYHTLAVVPILTIYVGRFLDRVQNDKIISCFGVLLILGALVPGLSISIMGPKVPDPSLRAFTYPGLSTEDFYRFSFPLEAPIWRYINRSLEDNAVILSHDNRYHVYRDDISIIHLDDCGLTPFYGKPYSEVHKELLERGIRYYLYIPDENSHPITRLLGHLDYLDNPDYFELIEKSIIRDQTVQLFKLINPTSKNSTS